MRLAKSAQQARERGKQLFRVAQHCHHFPLGKRLVAIWILTSREPWSFLWEKSRSNMGGRGVAFTPSEQQGMIHLCPSSHGNYSFSQTCQASGGKSKPMHHGPIMHGGAQWGPCRQAAEVRTTGGTPSLPNILPYISFSTFEMIIYSSGFGGTKKAPTVTRR